MNNNSAVMTPHTARMLPQETSASLKWILVQASAKYSADSFIVLCVRLAAMTHQLIANAAQHQDR